MLRSPCHTAAWVWAVLWAWACPTSATILSPRLKVPHDQCGRASLPTAPCCACRAHPGPRPGSEPRDGTDRALPWAQRNGCEHPGSSLLRPAGAFLMAVVSGGGRLEPLSRPPGAPEGPLGGGGRLGTPSWRSDLADQLLPAWGHTPGSRLAGAGPTPGLQRCVLGPSPAFPDRCPEGLGNQTPQGSWAPPALLLRSWAHPEQGRGSVAEPEEEVATPVALCPEGCLLPLPQGPVPR